MELSRLREEVLAVVDVVQVEEDVSICSGDLMDPSNAVSVWLLSKRKRRRDGGFQRAA